MCAIDRCLMRTETSFRIAEVLSFAPRYRWLMHLLGKCKSYNLFPFGVPGGGYSVYSQGAPGNAGKSQVNNTRLQPTTAGKLFHNCVD